MDQCGLIKHGNTGKEVNESVILQSPKPGRQPERIAGDPVCTMRSSRNHKEHHCTDRVGSLHATVLGANDGVVSSAGLLMGVAAASVSRSGLLIVGVAGLVAGALAITAGVGSLFGTTA